LTSSTTVSFWRRTLLDGANFAC